MVLNIHVLLCYFCSGPRLAVLGSSHASHMPTTRLVHRFGFPGATVRQVLARPDIPQSVTDVNPDVVFIILGGNSLDAAQHQDDLRHVSNELATLANLFHTRGIRVLLCEVLWRGKPRHCSFQDFQTKRSSVNRRLRRLAKSSQTFKFFVSPAVNHGEI